MLVQHGPKMLNKDWVSMRYNFGLPNLHKMDRPPVESLSTHWILDHPLNPLLPIATGFFQSQHEPICSHIDFFQIQPYGLLSNPILMFLQIILSCRFHDLLPGQAPALPLGPWPNTHIPWVQFCLSCLSRLDPYQSNAQPQHSMHRGQYQSKACHQSQPGLIAVYLIPGCYERGVRLGHESSSAAAGCTGAKSKENSTADNQSKHDNPFCLKCLQGPA